MKTKIKTDKKFIRIVTSDTLDSFLEKTFGHTYSAWWQEKPGRVYNARGWLGFRDRAWNDFKSKGCTDGLNADIILNGLAHDGYLTKGIYFVE